MADMHDGTIDVELCVSSLGDPFSAAKSDDEIRENDNTRNTTNAVHFLSAVEREFELRFSLSLYFQEEEK